MREGEKEERMSVIRTVALPIGLGLGFGLTLEYGFNVPFYIALPAGGALYLFSGAHGKT